MMCDTKVGKVLTAVMIVEFAASVKAQNGTLCLC